jgi:hypothetical protein
MAKTYSRLQENANVKSIDERLNRVARDKQTATELIILTGCRALWQTEISAIVAQKINERPRPLRIGTGGSKPNSTGFKDVDHYVIMALPIIFSSSLTSEPYLTEVIWPKRMFLNQVAAIQTTFANRPFKGPAAFPDLRRIRVF